MLRGQMKVCFCIKELSEMNWNLNEFILNEWFDLTISSYLKA